MRRFLIKVSVFSIPLLIFVACYFYVVANMTGDLGTIGMIPFGNYEVGEKPDFAGYYECYSIEDARDAEIVVIGDSFSEQHENSFENYLGKALGKKVCHLYIKKRITNPCAAANYLIENDLLPNCKVLVLESGERQAVWRLCNCFKDVKIEFKSPGNGSDEGLDISKYLNISKMSSFLKLSLNIDDPVVRMPLDGDYFSGKWADRLYFYASKDDGGGDLWYLDCSDALCDKAKDNLLKLRQKASDKGIDFYFLMPAGKLDMYFDKIVDNPYPANLVVERFSDMDTTWFVDGRKILTPLVESGVKDVYLKNDTHWSRLGAEVVGCRLARLIELKHGEER